MEKNTGTRITGIGWINTDFMFIHENLFNLCHQYSKKTAAGGAYKWQLN